MIIHFTITPKTNSDTVLEVKQTGIPDDEIANEYFEGCISGWQQILGNIKKYCEKN